MAGDVNFDNVALLLHGGGADNATTFTDSSLDPKTATAVGAPVISTAQSQFGGSSIRVTYESYISFAGLLSDLGTGDFTIEFWVRRGPLNVGWLARSSGGSASSTAVWISCDFDGNVFARCGAGSSYIGGCYAAAASMEDVGVHFAYVRSGASFALYADGVQLVTASSAASVNARSEAFTLRAAATGNEPDEIVYFDEVRVTKGVARYLAAFTPLAAPHPEGTSPAAILAAPGPLGAPALRAVFAVPLFQARAAVGSPLAAPRVLALHDFSALLGDVTSVYTMDLITPGGAVRVPVSSWQATLQTTDANYVQCVVPACGPWLDALAAATAFVIYRRAVLPGGQAFEYEMARAPAEQQTLDRGPERYTCTLSGYSPGFAEDLAPPAVYDRALAGVRSVSTGTGGTRVRCAVDWLLRPGHRAFVDDVPLVVAYINYYAPTGFDAYMDVGSRT